MIDSGCLHDIRTNINPGIEYEIALFYTLCQECGLDIALLDEAIASRSDNDKIHSIIGISSPKRILNELNKRNLRLIDVSFESQNDEVGPADIAMTVASNTGTTSLIGLSIKYANTCTLNVTGKRFLTKAQISGLQSELKEYTKLYIEEMNKKFGSINNWFRKKKQSSITDKYIDLIRDAVINNWQNIPNKEALFAALYHSDSPIEFWVIKYSNTDYTVNTNPTSIDFARVDEVVIRKLHTSFVAFYLDGIRIGHMQVKFNNGFVEKCKKKNPDIVEQGISMSYGHPFSSWNFSVEE